MSRQVDVKALVSHIVKGDGAEKCRICLGDTSEGQVYLGDTVMMDGEKPVTLAELLHLITGVEVSPEDDLPSGLCPACSHSALNAAAFRSLVKQSAERWDMTLQLLDTMPDSGQFVGRKSMYVVLSETALTIIDGDSDESQNEDNVESDWVTEPTKRHRQIKMKRQDCECPDCGKKFIHVLKLCKHFKDSTDFRRCCHICAAIMSREDLIVHLKDAHKTEPIDCKKCPALLLSVDELQRHMENAHGPGGCFCGDCGRSFQSPHALHGHLSAHVAKNCPKCDKLFRNHRCYLHHVPTCCNLDKNRDDTHHTKTKVLFAVKNKKNKNIKVGARGSADSECICDYCGKTFAGKKFVCAHIQIVHMRNTHRPCPYCGKLLAAARMSGHLKKHQEIKPYTCEHCGIVLKSKLGYVQHVRLHTGERPYKCKFCPETFSASSRRSEHIRKTHSEEQTLKHACNLCPARFRLPFRLKKHICEAHATKTDGPNVGFECPECHIMFGTCRGLLQHSKKHQIFFFKSRKKRSEGKDNSACVMAKEEK